MTNVDTTKADKRKTPAPKKPTAEYAVVKGVEIPEEVSGNGETRGRPPIYPFKDLGEIGDAFAIPDALQAARVRQTVNVKNRGMAEEGSAVRYRVGQSKSGDWYCWRIS